jgi:hypothetical protein
MLPDILLLVASLLGFSALVSLLVNVGKFFGLVKDDTADKWVAGLNLIGVLALYFTRMFIPDFDPTPIDSIMQEIAMVGAYVMSFVSMIFGSRLTYAITKGLPVIGKSFTDAKVKLLK